MEDMTEKCMLFDICSAFSEACIQKDLEDYCVPVAPKKDVILVLSRRCIMGGLDQKLTWRVSRRMEARRSFGRV